MSKFLFLIFTLTTFSWAQETTQISTKVAPEKLRVLRVLKRNLDWIRLEIQKKESSLSSTGNNDPKLQKAVEDLRHRQEEAQENFLLAASDVNYELVAHAPTPVEKRDLLKELQEVVAPILDNFRRMSARPRRLEAMKNRVHRLSEQYSNGQLAQENLTLIQAQVEPALFDEIEATKKIIQDKQEELQVEIDTLQGKLAQESKHDKSVFETATDLVKEFIQNKGKNLFFSILAFILILALANMFREKVLVPKILNRSTSSLAKTVDALYGIFAVIFAFLGLLLVLYLFNDWFLVTLTILLFMALIWSFKNFAPQFFQEMRLVLNLGTVKEGERVMLGGIPWLVKKLGMTSTLINPNLQGGVIRLSSQDLLKLTSRQWNQSEPWFPSQVNQWVLLSDHTYGKVLFQGPDQVVLTLFGGTQKFYRTEDFLKLSPQNFSHGFKLTQTFALHSSLQKMIIEEIPQKAQEQLTVALKKNHPQTFLDLHVEFHSSEDNGLLIWLSSHWAGEEAGNRFELMREINQGLIRLCNENGWKIPVKQFQVQMQTQG